MSGLVAITGANGFVGRRLCRSWAAQGQAIRALVRTATDFDLPGVEPVVIGDLATGSGLEAALDGVSTIVHLAALTHRADAHLPAALARYTAVNVDGSQRLAEAALAVGVRQFVFMSSIKVNGEQTADAGKAVGLPARFSADDVPRPQDHYGRTKLAAERMLTATLAEHGVTLSILRPPLIYGPGNQGNLLRLMHWIVRGWPLPLAAIKNRRSLIQVDNLNAAVMLAARAAQGGCYTLADIDLSTPQLIEALATGLGAPARLFPVPGWLLGSAARAAGKTAQWQRLSGSLVVDSSAIKARLGWHPAVAMTSAMTELGQWYRAQSW